MASFLTDLVKPYLEKLIDGAIGEFRYVCCFTSIAEEFKEEQARLEAERRTVEQRANVATGRGNNILFKAGEWEKKADQVLQEDTKTKKKCFFGFCPDCIWRYKRGKELADKIVNMKQLVVEGEKFENIEIPRPLPDVEIHSSQNYIHFKGRELEYKELLEALKDENNFTTGLHGMGGSGKTTLTKEVGKELKQSKKFSHVIDVTVSYTPNIKKIQDDIAGPLGLKLEDCNESDRPKKLWSRLTNGEKILVILDDVWDQKPPLDFDDIGIPKQDNHKGCRVLVTTRNKRVLNKMGCDEIIKLEVLSEEDSRIMFESYAGITNNSLKSLIDKGRKIADACKRLPVAIAAVASSLKGQESIEEWDLALKSLQNPLSSIQGDDESLVEIYNCLKFSYDFLKDEKVKRLFLLCSVFPEDEEINVEILTRISLGAGLFGEDYGRYNDARNQVVVAKNKLVDSCLLLEGDEGCVKMHDLVRDAAQWIANQEIRTVNMSHKDPKSLIDRDKNTKYLFWEGKVRKEFSSGFGGSNLEILIAILNSDGDGDCVEVPNLFFENRARLRVMVLFNEYQLLSLPQSFLLLTNIRSLIVGEADLGDISILGNLHCLETLDLVSCEINELPHEITKLKELKLLKLESCKIRRNNSFEVIGKCLFLDELYFQCSFNEFCKEIDFFPTLQRYVISTSWDVELNVSVSKAVKLVGDEILDIFSEATLKYFFQTTQYLVLECIKWQWRNLIPEIVPVDQGMNDIVYLDLTNSSELQYLIKVVGSQVPNVFSKLVVLKLQEMEKLEELCNVPLSSGSLKALEKLSISRCRNLRSLFKFNPDLCSLKKMTLKECPLLVSLFQLSTAKSLIMLEKLKIYDCGQLESIIADENSGEESKEEILVDDGDNEDKKNNSSIFPKLRVLEIVNCPQLEFILPFLSGDLTVPILEGISIESCDKLKYIFDQFVELGSLKELKLHQLPNLIGIFPKSGHLMPLFSEVSSSPLRENFKEPTQLDPIKCNVFSWTQKCCYGQKYKHKLRSTTSTKIPLLSKCFSGQPQILCNITTIELNTISKIKSVFTLSTARRMLQLETLTIQYCDELKHIIVDTGDDNGGNNSSNVFPRLKKLNVYGCNQLEYIFGHYADDHESHNEIHLHLPELKSLELGNLQSLVAMCPKQYHTTFPSLVNFEVNNCSQVASKSIGDFICHGSSTSLDNTTIKCFSGQPQNLCNITTIKLERVSKIKSVFTLSTARRMLQLESLTIWWCEELKHIIVDIGDDNGGNNSSNVFPRLKELTVYNCEQLEYIFGHCADDHESHNEIHLHLPELKSLHLEYMPNLVAMSPKQYHTTFPSLVNLELDNCSQVASKLIGDFISNASSTSTTMKCFSGQPQNLCNITTIKLTRVSKIKSVFTLSTARRMLQLETLTIWICDELKHIIVDIGDDNGGNNSSNVFPRLKELKVYNCEQLEYIFGHCADDHESHNEIHLHLPELKSLNLVDLPSLVAMCPKQYHTTFPSLVNFKLNNCSQVASKSIGDFISNASSTSTTMKKLSGNLEHFLALEELQVTNSKVENVFILNETNGQQLNLMLNDICLEDLHVMKYLFVGPKSSATLHNLTQIDIERCEKLKTLFSTCVVRCFPQLRLLSIKGCNDLKHIIEEDAEDEMMSNYLPTATGTCFPKLESLAVVDCNKLEFVFPVSICKELHKLKVLMIREANALQEVFRSKDAQKVEIPNLKVIVFVNLPSLSQTQTIQFQNVEHRLVENCQKLSLTSISTLSDDEIEDLDLGLYIYIHNRKKEDSDSKTTNDLSTEIQVQATWEHDSVSSSSESLVASEPKTSSNEVGYGKISITSQTNDQRVKEENLIAETGKDLSIGVEVQAASRHKLTSSQEFLNEPSTSQQHPVGEADTTAKPSRGNNCLEETKVESIKEVLISEKATTTVTESFKRSDEQGTTLDNVNTVTSSTPIESNVEHRLVENCQKNSLTSVSTLSDDEIEDLHFGVSRYIKDRREETTKDFATGIQVQATSGHELSSSQSLEEIQTASASETRSKPPTQSLSPKSKQENFKTSVEEGTMLVNAKTITSSAHSESGSLVTSEHNTSSNEFPNEPSTSQQHPVREADTTANPSQGNNCLEETKDESIQEVLISEKATTTVMGSFKRSDEQGTTLDNVNTVTTSTSIESVSSEHKTSLHVKEDEIRVSEPKPSPTTTSALASQSISTPYEGNPPQTVENPSSSSLITKELQQLVSKKHLASEKLTLLTDFLVKYPSVRLMDNSLSNRYKGYAYNCLGELLKFLQTHSVLDVLESSHSEFVELLQDTRRCGFDKGWLDGVEKRVLFPDLHLSQDALEKLFHSKQQVTKEIEMLRLKIGIFTQHVEEFKHQLASSEAVLENISQQEAQVLESRAALSAPLGY